MSPEAGAGLGSPEFLTTPIPAPSQASAAGGGARPVRRVALPQAEATAEPGARPVHPGRAHVPGPPDRFEADLGAVVLVTDRGVAHARNEDAVAAGVGVPAPGRAPVTVAVVCDGVSSSPNPQAASGTAARTGVDACLNALAEGRPVDDAATAGLAAAAGAVRDIASIDGDSPSCTYVGAIVHDDGAGNATITVANVGDSRAYWLVPGDGEHDEAEPASRRLTLDDSWAQALVDAGAMDETAAMNDPRAHTLLRWLGADYDQQPWSSRSVQSFRCTGPGVLLLCSDGLWNYLPDPVALAAIATAKPPAHAARDLADYAVACGGGDNITVALVPVGGPGPT
ncbi:PP2C family protein-serine/threonine phosphatase [Nocardia cyriacigeorgica]|uniref:Phosphatase n=1 Tax=Nocardia cyriacigeorgica TaxID=135487 RepID=A0A5R8NM37_9NOCA|nr:PP2C family serine/threonine-protein phosphatase [Nocardia cyriacigeorgica]TLF76671.1 phosphatase [Nocardia cyriacigeorgica]